MIRNISWEKQKPNHLLVLHGLGTRAFVLWSFRTSASITSVQVCLKTTKFYLDTCLLLMQTYSITTRFLHKCKKIIDQLDWINDTWNTVYMIFYISSWAWVSASMMKNRQKKHIYQFFKIYLIFYTQQLDLPVSFTCRQIEHFLI